MSPPTRERGPRNRGLDTSPAKTTSESYTDRRRERYDAVRLSLPATDEDWSSAIRFGYPVERRRCPCRWSA
jgi:hypothetical protein